MQKGGGGGVRRGAEGGRRGLAGGPKPGWAGQKREGATYFCTPTTTA